MKRRYFPFPGRMLEMQVFFPFREGCLKRRCFPFPGGMLETQVLSLSGGPFWHGQVRGGKHSKLRSPLFPLELPLSGHAAVVGCGTI